MYTYENKRLFPNTSFLDHVNFNSKIEKFLGSTFSSLTPSFSPDKRVISKLKKHINDTRKNYENIIIVGMGGTMTNLKALLKLRYVKNIDIPKILFVDNTDINNIIYIENKVNLAVSKFFIISKSGNTLETISNFLTFFELYRKKNIQNKNQHFCFITSPKESKLRSISMQYNISTINLTDITCGRFSSFKTTTLLLGSIAGLNMEAFCDGGEKVLQECIRKKAFSYPAQAAKDLTFFDNRVVINIAFNSMIYDALEWYAQIQAESLSKKNHYVIPITAQSQLAHHSHLQLYLNAEKNILFTLIRFTEENDRKLHENSISNNIGVSSIKDVNNRLYTSMYDTFVDHKLPTRIIEFTSLNEYNLGALMMHCTLETILAGYLMEINPLTQPSIEKIKKVCLP